MKTPWHLWVVGILGTLWSLVGCFDYYMTATQNAAYFEGFTAEQREYFFNLPAWYMGAFAIGVWASLLGCILLLLRRRFAFPVLLISFLGLVVTSVWSFFFAEDVPQTTTLQTVMMIVVYVVAIFLLIYSRQMSKSGVLR